MTIDSYFYRISIIYENAINQNKQIVIFPLGKVGLYAHNLISNRFGTEVIRVDNSICNYNDSVMSIEDYKNIDSDQNIILLCTTDGPLNDKLYCLIKELNLKSSVISLLDNPIEKSEGKADLFLEIKKILKVKKIRNFKLIRIGEENDGGYVMLDDFENIQAAYSFGISTNSMWDLDISEKNIDTFCYDPSVSGIIGANSKIHFHRFGLSSKKSENIRYKDFITLIKENGHENFNNMILKMDIEGAEWECLDYLDVEFLRKFRQMSFELHGITSTDKKEQIIRALRKLTKYHDVIWVHGNNAGKVEQAGMIVLPEYLELTLCRRDDYIMDDCDYNCPLDIDKPNTDIGRDISLEHWND